MHVSLTKQWPDDSGVDSPAPPHAAILWLFARILTQEYKTWFEIAGAWVRVRAWCTCSKSISHSEWQASICRVFFPRLVWYHPWAVEEAPVTFFPTISSEYYIRTTCSITFELFDRNALHLFCSSFFSFVVNGLTWLDSTRLLHKHACEWQWCKASEWYPEDWRRHVSHLWPSKEFWVRMACSDDNVLVLSSLCDWMEWSEWSSSGIYFKIRMNQYQNQNQYQYQYQYQNESEPAVEINVSVDCKRYLWTCHVPSNFLQIQTAHLLHQIQLNSTRKCTCRTWISQTAQNLLDKTYMYEQTLS